LGQEAEIPDFLGMSRDDLFGFIMDYALKWRELADARVISSYNEVRNGKDVVINTDEIAFHLVNHHTYHRGQIVMGLRMLGKNVEMTDYIPYRIKTA
jgi:uncharacterized damage-inducible protein DinB